MTAPIGIAPLVNCLAILIISGTTANSSAPVFEPIRPKAVITSSKINRISFWVHISLNRCKYPCGGGMTPADPATGSTITAAILEASCNAISSSKSSASSAPFSGIPLVNLFSGSMVWGKWSAATASPKNALLPPMPPTLMPPKLTPW